MLTCSNCGASVREGARFCTTCGTRLNDPVASDATSVWNAPFSNVEPAVTGEEPVAVSATQSGDSSDDDDASPDSAATAEADPDAAHDEGSPDPETDSEASPTPNEGFTWSWGTSSSTNDGPGQTTDQVDEESGIVLEEADSAAATEDTDPDEPVDATEIDILDVDDSDTGYASSEDDEPDPETSDTMLVVDDDEQPDGAEENETLAAWAEQWESPEPDGDPAPNDERTEPEPEHPTALDQAADTAVTAGNVEPSPGDEEDAVARADRLIGELRALIPSLVRPLPAAPTIDADTLAIADELEDAARAGQFDDIRETLLAAREHPRDVDTMLNLSGNIDRLIELLDDRDHLANLAGSAATRLRPVGNATGV